MHYIIADCTHSANGDNKPVEELHLNYTKIDLSYYSADADGQSQSQSQSQSQYTVAMTWKPLQQFKITIAIMSR